MKFKTLSVIKCPKCESNSFTTKIIKKNNKEVREGIITCKNCSLKMKIDNGILNLIHNPSKVVLNEMKENDEVADKRKVKNDKWLLSLPLADNFGNEKYPQINKGYLENVKFILKKINFKGKKVLEIGAGTCWTTNLFAKAGADIIATDISSEKFIGLSSSDIFFKYNHIFFERILCSMDNLPFQDSSFDIVICNAAIHHSPDIRKSFKEISRVLRKDGLYFQTNEPVCSLLNFSRKIDIQKSKKKGMDVADGWFENTYSYGDYKKFLRNNGLKGKFFFPPSFDIILLDKTALKGIKSYKRIIGEIIMLLWRIRALQSFFKLLFPLSLYLFGGNVVLIAQKR